MRKRGPTVAGGQRLVLLSEESHEVAEDYRRRTTISTEARKARNWQRKWRDSKKNQEETRQRGVPLDAAKNDETDFGRDAETNRGANRSQTAIHIKMRHGRRRGREREVEGLNGGSVRSGTIRGCRRKKRTLVKAGDIVGNETRG